MSVGLLGLIDDVVGIAKGQRLANPPWRSEGFVSYAAVAA